ncbi:MAG: PilC/PilY family type IV pilus protein, partial [Myxococcota bacterium]
DGDYDIVTCSLSEERLIYWRQDNVGNFTRAPDISYPPGGCNQAMAGDFDADGDLDIGIARDGFTCNGTGGYIHLFFNDGSGDFIFVSDPVVNGGNDLDLGVALEIDGDDRGQTDIIAADGNDSGAYYQVIPSELSIYSLEGEAISTVIQTANPNEAIVSITVSALNATVPNGTSATYFVSNNNGETWEALAPEELPAGGGQPHDFANYGTQLRFRIQLGAEEDTLVGDDIVHAPASFETPEIRNIQFSYSVVDRREYSRSSVALASGITIGGTERNEVVYSASFFFPGFEADIRAFDVSNLSAVTGLQRADTDPDATELFSVGQLLTSDAPGSSRNLMVAYPSTTDGDGRVNDLVELQTSQISTPGSSPSLQSLLTATNDQEARDVIDFVRGGMAHPDDWKFYDVGHSSPIFVGPPTGDPAFFGTGYSAFATSEANRDPFLVIGANDGFLRGIDAEDGQELWGIVPHNLAGKLRQMRVERNGNFVYEHQFSIDGPIVVADVQDSASQWRTVVLSGQAQGQGAGDSNYYFALDVTDPANPQSLWEFTDPWDGSAGPSCDGDPCETVCTAAPPSTVCTADCTQSGKVFQQSSAGVITFEAEDFNNETNLTTGSDERHWEIRTDEPGYSGTGHVTAAPDGINCFDDYTNCGALMTFQFEAPVGEYRLA